MMRTIMMTVTRTVCTQFICVSTSCQKFTLVNAPAVDTDRKQFVDICLIFKCDCQSNVSIYLRLSVVWIFCHFTMQW